MINPTAFGGTHLDLAAIRARAEAATPAPWYAEDTGLTVGAPEGRALVLLAEVLLSDEDTRENHPQAKADAEFIAHAREDVPVLLAEVERLRTQVDGEESAVLEETRERDRATGWADRLASAIAVHIGVDVGEHSYLNCPWQNALDLLAGRLTGATPDMPAWRCERGHLYGDEGSTCDGPPDRRVVWRAHRGSGRVLYQSGLLCGLHGAYLYQRATGPGTLVEARVELLQPGELLSEQAGAEPLTKKDPAPTQDGATP